MRNIIIERVTVAANPAALSEGPYGRSGTAIAPEWLFVKLLGEPDRSGSPDEKVTIQWFLNTPRGLVCVRDYWWNRPGEWSLAGPRKATLWAAAFLRTLGARAASGVRGYDVERVLSQKTAA